MNLHDWTVKRNEILDRHQHEVQRLIREVDRIQRRVSDTTRLHQLELAQWDDAKPRLWKGFGLGL